MVGSEVLSVAKQHFEGSSWSHIRVGVELKFDTPLITPGASDSFISALSEHLPGYFDRSRFDDESYWFSDRNGVPVEQTRAHHVSGHWNLKEGQRLSLDFTVLGAGDSNVASGGALHIGRTVVQGRVLFPRKVSGINYWISVPENDLCTERTFPRIMYMLATAIQYDELPLEGRGWLAADRIDYGRVGSYLKDPTIGNMLAAAKTARDITEFMLSNGNRIRTCSARLEALDDLAPCAHKLPISSPPRITEPAYAEAITSARDAFMNAYRGTVRALDADISTMAKDFPKGFPELVHFS